MRVLIDCSALVTGGALQVGLGIIHQAARTPGHDWHLALSAELAAQVTPDVAAGFRSVTQVGPFRRSWARVGAIHRTLPGLERDLRPDVVFTAFGPPFWRGRAPHLVGFALPAPLYPESLAWRRLGVMKRWCRRLTYAVRCSGLRRAGHLVVETDTVRRRLQDVLGFPASRVFVVRNSYSPVFREAVGRDAGRPADRARIFVPSSYYPHKNLEVIPETARELRRLLKEPFEFLLTVPADGPPWRRIRARAEALGVGDAVRTAGPVHHGAIAGHYRSASAVFLPTLLECSTAVYPESFMAGVPLCTSDLDFARELCADGALYFDPCDPAAAARALHRALTDDALGADLIARGRRVLERNYPTPEGKWREQLDCLHRVAGRPCPCLPGRDEAPSRTEAVRPEPIPLGVARAAESDAPEGRRPVRTA
jgi:glycosyltransferase involved in cell wall biosynthesis